MRVFDSFIFFNELELLEMRLNILNDVVDYFVLTESPFTVSGFSATAKNPPITVISDTFHREVNGKFSDEVLGESISYFGELYQKVSDAPKKSSWVIDPQLIEEIIDMAAKSALAGPRTDSD